MLLKSSSRKKNAKAARDNFSLFYNKKSSPHGELFVFSTYTKIYENAFSPVISNPVINK